MQIQLPLFLSFEQVQDPPFPEKYAMLFSVLVFLEANESLKHLCGFRDGRLPPHLPGWSGDDTRRHLARRLSASPQRALPAEYGLTAIRNANTIDYPAPALAALAAVRMKKPHKTRCYRSLRQAA